MGGEAALQRQVWKMGLGDLAPLPNADKLTAPMMAKLVDGRLADPISWDYFQRIRFASGVVIPLTPLRMFGAPNGAQQPVFNTGVTYQQNDDDTNLDISGQLQKDYEYWQAGIWCKIDAPGNTPTTETDQMPVNIAPLASAAAASVVHAVSQRAVITNKIGSKDYEKGPAYMFPCPYGVSGFSGAGSGSDFMAVVQNGAPGVWREFDVWHQIGGGVAFGPMLQLFGNLISPIDFTLTVGFRGILFRDVR